VGLNLNTGYELAEVRVQWMLADFGRRMGRYRQAEIGVDVAQLQTERAYQTVANDVALAYYQVLRARSLKRIAEEAVRRAEDDLDVAKKLEKGGVIEKEKALRAEVLLSQARRGLDAAEAGAGVSVAALNLAIGLNVSAPTEVILPPSFPEFDLTLATVSAGPSRGDGNCRSHRSRSGRPNSAAGSRGPSSGRRSWPAVRSWTFSRPTRAGTPIWGSVHQTGMGSVRGRAAGR